MFPSTDNNSDFYFYLAHLRRKKRAPGIEKFAMLTVNVQR